MSSAWSVQKTLRWLDEMKQLVTGFVAREQQLEQDCRRQSARKAARVQEALNEQSRARAQALETKRAALKERKERIRAWHASRQGRLVQAHKSSHAKAFERSELDEGRRKYELQKSLLETERSRKQALADNDAAFEEFKGRLAANREGFVDLEESARTAFRGYRGLSRLLYAPDGDALPAPKDEHKQLEQLNDLHGRVSQELAGFGGLILPRLFRYLPVWLLGALLAAGHGAVLIRGVSGPLRIPVVDPTRVWSSLGISLLVLLGLYFLGKRRAKPSALRIANDLTEARRLHNACLEAATLRHQLQHEQIEAQARERTRQHNEAWAQAVQEGALRRETFPQQMDAKAARANARHQQLHDLVSGRLARDESELVSRHDAVTETERGQLVASLNDEEGRLAQEQDERWKALEADWNGQLVPLFAEAQALAASAQTQFPDWSPELWKDWAPPSQFSGAVRFARLRVDLAQLCGGLPLNPRLALPGPASFTLPLFLTFPEQPSPLFETVRMGSEQVSDTLNNIVLRLLSHAPAGRMSFTIIDPVKLGQNFAGVMHLADFEENLIDGRIWTQPGEIDQRLADLNDHMEKVIQMYLRNEYPTIADYNEQAGSIAEKYHFLVIADFPVHFGETAVRRLLNIAASGARCGVYMLVHWDRRQPLPPGIVLDDLRQNAICIARGNDAWLLAGHDMAGLTLDLDPAPGAELATELLQKIGLSSQNANRVEVPFIQVAPEPSQVWSLDTGQELRVPIGRTGATKLQYLAIGKGTRQHTLVAGKTGSGKSTLFHVLVTNLALWCSPDQVEFYLVDFKKGVEFKCYATARLPHARVIAIESDREFGLSVLQRVDDELRKRGDLFRELGVQDLAGYRRAKGAQRMPRSLLLIDEFQELFVEDDHISQGAAVLLDRIVRQGRAFGIHVVLGSQTLGGAYTLARTTIGQMVIRVALQCNEADAYLIMDDNNPAPRLLSRPGEGIYNDMAGAVEGNSPFQAVWLSDHEREHYLEQVRTRADQAKEQYPAPFVFEGNAAGDVRDNPFLQAARASSPTAPPDAARLWLGAPNAIKGPTEALLRRQSGHHLLLVGQRDEAILAIFTVSLISLAAQYPPNTIQLAFLDSTPPGSPQHEWLQRVLGALPCPVRLARGGNLAEVLGPLTEEMKRRGEDEYAAGAPAAFLFIHGLQNFKKLRHEEDFGFSADDSQAGQNPAAMLNELICNGAAQGIHVIASCDTYNNVSRFLGRKALSEFELRVLFQMSANDSASLIDSPKASNLGLHRALFYNEHEGYLETFRPYALPPGEWLEERR